MKKEHVGAIEEEWRIVRKIGRIIAAIVVGCALLWLPTRIQTDIDFILVAKGMVMFFGFLFLLTGLMALFGFVTGKPLLTEQNIKEILKE